MKTLLTTETVRFREELKSQGYAQKQCHSALLSSIRQLAAVWAAFCNQSLEHKLKLPYEKSRWYEYKDPANDPTVFDYKENFHLRRGMVLPSNFQATEIDKLLLQSGYDFLNEMRPLIQSVAFMLSDITGVDFVALTDDEQRTVARLLHYFGKMKGAEWDNKDLAEAHPDKAGLTFAVYESLPGLRGFWNGTWQSVQAKPGHIVVFGGLLCQLYSKGIVKAFYHDVEKSPVNDAVGRFSVVNFRDFISDWVYDKDTFGSTQKAFKGASNYTMSFEEFQARFKRVS